MNLDAITSIFANYDIMNLRSYAAILLAIGFVASIFYALSHQGKGLVLAVILIAGAGTLFYFEHNFQQNQRSLTAAVQRTYSNTTLYVHCERFVDSLGDTVGADERAEADNPGMVWVDNPTCNETLAWVAGDKTNTTLAQAKALYQWSADAAPRAGASGTCAALQNLPALLTQAGASEAEASAVAHLYYDDGQDSTISACPIY